MEKPYKDLKEITANHSKVYDDLVKGEIDVKQAVEINNAFGKIINSFKVQVEVSKLNKAKPSLDF